MGEMYKTIKKLCDERGVSVSAFAREIGISKSAMSELKAGRTQNLSTESTKKAAAYFGVTTDYLLGNDQKENPLVNQDQELTEYLEELKNREDLRMLFSLAKGATKEDVMQAVKIIEALRDK